MLSIVEEIESYCRYLFTIQVPSDMTQYERNSEIAEWKKMKKI